MEVGGRFTFPLPILTQWFAAHALLRSPAHIADIIFSLGPSQEADLWSRAQEAAEHCSQLHPLAAEWLYPVVYSSVIHEFVYSNAITEYTYSWLEADLRRVQWRE